MLGVCAELDPPFLSSTGWRLSLGSGVDGTVCAFARGAKNCKIARAAGAGPFCGPPGLDARTWLVDLCGQERRGELSTWWLPRLLCVEPCSTHVVEVVCSCTVQSDSQTTGPVEECRRQAWELQDTLESLAEQSLALGRPPARRPCPPGAGLPQAHTVGFSVPGVSSAVAACAEPVLKTVKPSACLGN